MEIAGLTLAIPPTVAGILKCIKLFNEIHDKLGGASDKLQRVLVKCLIKSMEHLLRKLRVDPDDASTLHDIKVIDFIWKDAEVKSLTNLLNECRDDVAFYLMVQIVYQKFAHAALPSLPPASRIQNDHQQTLAQELPNYVNKKDEDAVAATLPDSLSNYYIFSILDGGTTAVQAPLGKAEEPIDFVLEQKEARLKIAEEPAIPNAFYVRAIYTYKAHDRTSLSFREGDVIKVITQLESGWWDGVLDQVRGWFPSNYTRIISSVEAKDSEKPREAMLDDIIEEDELSDEPGAFEDLDEHQPAAAFWIPQANSNWYLVRIQCNERGFNPRSSFGRRYIF
ncbi:hypothetical protein B0O99DRAFT_590843 [Bisporella sp. PMI_857]|nr:hypothetical protein B0O99DRAFT_590843 [Bisporella sp. PMI_857]